MAITTLISIPSSINQGINAARQMTMKTLLGNPRSDYSNECQPVTNPTLKRLIKTDSVGPFRTTGLAPAIDSLKLIMSDIQAQQPLIYQALGSAGMLCVRLVRGSSTSISNHSWGTAIDLTLNGILDTRGDNKTQQGLADIAPIFNKHQWYWGAGFPTEDAMHFEASDQLIRKWHSSGLFNATLTNLRDPELSIGDRGREVAELQRKLNANGEKLVVDGIFGLGTHAAVVAFQAANNLVADGIVGKKTRTALGF